MSIQIKRYGWRRQLPDHRDQRFGVQPIVSLPPAVDLRPKDVGIYDQGQLGSCTANAICAAYLFDRKKQGLPMFEASRLFLYYCERAMEGTVDQDAGANIRDGFKVLNSQGVCDSHLWPYVVSAFAAEPSKAAFANALLHRSVKYGAVSQSLNAFKEVLASGFPVVIGITVYESFESSAVAETGIVPMPAKSESAIGGHAVCVVGYSDTEENGVPAEHFIVRNSWGAAWGRRGYFFLPYEYAMNPNLASDFWSVQSIL